MTIFQIGIRFDFLRRRLSDLPALSVLVDPYAVLELFSRDSLRIRLRSLSTTRIDSFNRRAFSSPAFDIDRIPESVRVPFRVRRSFR